MALAVQITTCRYIQRRASEQVGKYRGYRDRLVCATKESEDSEHQLGKRYTKSQPSLDVCPSYPIVQVYQFLMLF